MLYLPWCSKAVELKKQFCIMDKERAIPPPLAWSASTLAPLAPLPGLQQACPLFWGSTGLNRSLLVPTAPGIKHGAPGLPLRLKKGALAEIALHKEKHGKWLPPSVWSNRHAVPPYWDLGVCPLFPPFPFCLFFFSNIYEEIFHLSWRIFSTVGVSWEGSDNKLQKVFSPKQQLPLLANVVSGAFPEDWPKQKRGEVVGWLSHGLSLGSLALGCPGGQHWWKALGQLKRTGYLEPDIP